MTKSYEYLDHTADIQIHAWGDTLADAFVNTAYGMIDYMAERTELHIDTTATVKFSVKGRDLQALLFNFLDEILCLFVAEPYLHICKLTITSFSANEIHVKGEGQRFERSRQRMGTEVKAITYSNMKISTAPPYDIYVVVDI